MLDSLANWIEQLVTAWTGGLGHSGYLGIFVLMTIESSFIPFPSEIVMIPAGVLAHHGQLNLWGVIASGIAGSLAGALFNYFFALWVGRNFLERYGRYFFVNLETLHRCDRLWQEHGEMTTFVCRLLPAVRQLISIPAGLARMPLERFCLWTTLGAGLWVTVLTLAGYFLGDATERIWHEHKTVITLGLLVAAGLLAGLFLVWKLVRRRSPGSTESFGMTVAPPVEGETVPPTKP